MYSVEIPTFETLFAIAEVYERAIAYAWLSDELWTHIPKPLQEPLRKALNTGSDEEVDRALNQILEIFKANPLPQPLLTLTHNSASAVYNILQFRHNLQTNGAETLERYFNYKHPLAEDLLFKNPLEDPSITQKPKWIASDDRGRPIRKWQHLTPTTIVVELPKKPANIYDEAVAIAAYNDDGPGYLLTCC